MSIEDVEKTDTVDIRDSNIDTKDIMHQIRDNINKRKEKGIYTDEMEKLINAPLVHQCNMDNIMHDDLQRDIDYINSNWNIRTEYSISSHRPFLGRFLIWGRKLIHEEVRRYIYPIIERQSEFNACIVRLIRHINSKDRIDKIISDIDNNIDIRINDAINKNIDIGINKKIRNDSICQKNIYDVMNYFTFEEKFRGNTDEIKKRQSIFIEYFKNCKNVLDIGCGRGEFLSVLKENNIDAKGVDVNDDMVLYCRKNNFDVLQSDALSYLEQLNDKSLDGIFLGHIIEHFQPGQLIDIIKLCYDKMIYGAYLIAETINPLCMSALTTSFYADLSHTKPIHPETIKFLLESAKFRDVQTKFLAHFPDTIMLSKLDINDDMNDDEKMRLEIMNNNIDKLNSLLYGYQDYAVIAKK